MLLRSILAVLSGPVVYGMVCVPVTWLIVKLFPTHFDESWNTSHTGILTLIVSLTLVFAGTSGFVGAWIARDNVWLCIAIMCGLQLGIGIAVQRQYWTVLPLWYHLTFFTLLVLGTLLGAGLRVSLGFMSQSSTTESFSQIQLD